MRPVLTGAGLLLLLGAATLVGLHYLQEGAPVVSRISAPATQSLGASGTQESSTHQTDTRPAAKLPEAPAFDTVRVSPRGDAVIAGTAAPDQTVTVHDGTTELGHVTADAAGQWVLIPDQPLRPGPRELTVTAPAPEGGEIAGQRSVLLVVPARPFAQAGGHNQPQNPAQPSSGAALAVLTPFPGSGEASRVLQAPGLPAAGDGAKTRLDLDVVDYDDHGAVSFAGHAPPGARLRVYVDNAPVADATADAQARWVEKPGTIAPGQHRVRVDQVDAAGHVIRRVELPFMRETLAAQSVAPGQVVVQPGNTLWRLARNAYGQGIRYTVIYDSNSAVIRDPDKIYPGQVLSLPDAATAAKLP